MRDATGMNRTDGTARMESPRYKWLVLSNTTIAVLLATIDSSIMLIAMPEIFRGIDLDPLQPANSFYLLWMLLGYLMVSSVLVVSFGRLGDIFGRVKMYNLGFAIYTFFSLVLALDPFSAQAGALWLVIGRIFQGVGAAFLTGNSSAILTDAFPPNQRGLALGINTVTAISGSFIGLVLGGVLASIDWRLIFLVSVPFGVFGTIWSYMKLHDVRQQEAVPIDWLGNATFALGFISLMFGITFGIEPANGNAMGWTSTTVLSLLGTGVAFLVAFVIIESRVPHPMFRLALFRIRAFTFGTLSTFLSAMSRGGLMFMLVIWLQGIWLPLHGYSFEETPFWAGILMLPLSIGALVAGPLSGYLSDRFDARYFTAGGMLITAASFLLLTYLPVDFQYADFAVLLFLNGFSMGAFSSPNRAAIMNALPSRERGAGGGMNATFQNSAQVFSIGIFFSLILSGFAATLPDTLTQGLAQYGIAPGLAAQVGHLPPASILFASFLGFNPIKNLVPASALQTLPAQNQAILSGHDFFPNLIAPSFHTGLNEAFTFAACLCLVAAASSWTRGQRYVHDDEVLALPAFAAEE
jgi:EmrB/QacA subfamily drug resistance transporter